MPTGPTFPAGPTLELFPECAPISSPEESPASPPQSPATAEDLATSAGYGLRSLKLFVHLAPRGSWRRTLSDSLASGLTALSGSAGHWESSVTTAGRSSSALSMWVRHTCASDVGLLPTPTTPYGTRNNGARGDGTTYRTAGSPSLDTMARKGLWPTPTCDDANNITRASGDYQSLTRAAWPTPTANDAFGAGSRNTPTPTAQDAENNASPSQARTTPPLNSVAGGALNPTWVEWLLGYPLGWTDCGPSATRSSRR